jgi:hypothetical protein
VAAAGARNLLAAQGMASTEFQDQAAFLAQFPNFIEWPDDAFPAPKSPFVICVFGDFSFGSHAQRDISRPETRSALGKKNRGTASLLLVYFATAAFTVKFCGRLAKKRFFPSVCFPPASAASPPSNPASASLSTLRVAGTSLQYLKTAAGF